MFKISKKKRSVKLSITAHIAFIFGVLFSVLAGVLTTTLIKDGGAALAESINVLIFNGHLWSGILFYVLAAICLLAFIIGCCQKKAKGLAIRRALQLDIALLVAMFGVLFIACYANILFPAINESFLTVSTNMGALAMFISLLLSILCFATYYLIVFLVFIETISFTTGRTSDEDYLEGDPTRLTEEDMRNVIRDELETYFGNRVIAEPAAEEEAPAQEEEPAPAEEPAEEVKEEVKEAVEEEPVAEEHEAVEEAPAEEPAPVVEPVVIPVENKEKSETLKQLDNLHLKPADLDGNGRISFVERLLVADEEILEIYNTLKNKLLSYGLNARLSAGGDTFRLHRNTYAKITISGKKVKIYLALNPQDYKDSTIPFVDVGHKKAFEQIPFAFKVRSGLSIRRALELIEATMEKGGIVEQNEPETYDYAHELVEALKDIRDGKAE